MRVGHMHSALNSARHKSSRISINSHFASGDGAEDRFFRILMDDHIDSDSVAQVIESGITFSWENVTVHTNHERDSFFKKSMKEIIRIPASNVEPNKILDSVTGHADGGSLVAIMGPSGAGKTTLLAALARKIELSSGHIRINGCSVSEDSMSRIAGYLPQIDALPSALTAMEYMLFTCALRLDKRTSVKERNILASSILAQHGLLGRCHDTLISKLSDGETKRLSLAVELVTKPKILFLDEPTSGLDTWTAMRVIESVKSEASNGTLIFCSIHQPAMDLYKMFSHVILLANGKTAYYGTLENATKFFNSEGFRCPKLFNEAEYYVKIVSNGNLVDSLQATDSFLISDYSAQVYDSFQHSTYWKASEVTQNHGSIEFEYQTHKPNQFVQFYWISWRIWVQMRRTVFQNTTQHYTFVISAIMVATFFYGVNSRTQTGIQNVRDALYLISSEVIFSTAYSVVYDLPHEIPLYLREKSTYNPAAYYIATVLGSMPSAISHALIFLAFMFLAMDLNANFVTFMQFAAYVTAATIASSAYGTVISSWIENYNIATTVMVPIDLLSFMMAGVFYKLRSMPAYLSWLKYLSIFYYTNEAFAIIHWTRVDFIECYPDEDFPCLKNGREVLAEYGYNESNLWLDGCGLFLLTVVMHLLGYLGVKRRRAVKSIY